MKKKLLLIVLMPLVANAQEVSGGFNAGSFVGVLIAIGFIVLLFLALRQLVLWYWKVDKIVAYQEQNINALQALYNSQQELLKVTKEQSDTLSKINEQLRQNPKLQP